MRYEWRAWKRILQMNPKHRWRPVSDPTKAVLRRLYHEDAAAEEDWSLVCSREVQARRVVTDEVEGKDELLDEWLVSVTSPGTYYSVDTTQTDTMPDGSITRQRVTRHFTLLETAHGNHRPKMMHTHTSADDICLTAHLAFEVVLFDTFVPEGADADAPADFHHIFRTADPHWVTPRSLAGQPEDWYSRFFVNGRPAPATAPAVPSHPLAHVSFGADHRLAYRQGLAWCWR